MLLVTRFTCFCFSIVLLSTVWMLKSLLLCNITVPYCFEYGIVEVKEYFFHFFAYKNIIFFYVIHVPKLSSYMYYFSIYVTCLLCVVHMWM
jgi:hypothetical protein